MKILIGILYTFENEYEECIKSIKKQKDSVFDFIVIKNLPNKKAHDKLYTTFMENKDNYDLYIKIDADMILISDFFLKRISKFFHDNPCINHYTIPVHDFFTNREVYGLHIYRNNVKWVLNSDQIFVDRTDTNTEEFFDDGRFSPVALHAPNPSLFQAFHFGLHKAVKFTQYGSASFFIEPSVEHWQNISYLLKNYKNKKKLTLQYALAGCYFAMRYKMAHENINFNDNYALKLYKKLQKIKTNKLKYFIINIYIQTIISKIYYIWFAKKEHNVPITTTYKRVMKVI